MKDGVSAGGESPGDTLRGLEVALTGRFASMTRDEAEVHLRAAGATPVRQPGSSTDLLVVGSDGWPLRDDGRPTRALERARELQGEGRALRIASEEEFLVDLGLDDRRDAIHRLCTASELSRILRVPRSHIRRLSRAGLIHASKTVHRLEFYEFREVAAAKDLVALLARGVSVERIRQGLERVRAWLPGAEDTVAGRAIFARDGELLVRLDGGELADATGQLRIDFDGTRGASLSSPPSSTPIPVKGARVRPEASIEGAEPDSPPRDARGVELATPDEWFERGQRAEESGSLEEASDAYQNALRAGAAFPEVHFNLGNVLYLLENPAEAAAEFLRAVEIDPDYVEVWNNLGNALSELGQGDGAIRAYQRALELAPEYLDAHFNLAETLWSEERLEEARAHYWIYLRHDPVSPWADQVKARLGSRLPPEPKA